MPFHQVTLQLHYNRVTQQCVWGIFIPAARTACLRSPFRWIDCFINPLLVFRIPSILPLSENFSALFLLLSDDASLQNSLIGSLRRLFALCPPRAGRGGKDGEAEGMSESDAVCPQVSFFYETIKARFYMKLLKNGLCFNSVWGRSLNLSHSTPDEKKKKKKIQPLD